MIPSFSHSWGVALVASLSLLQACSADDQSAAGDVLPPGSAGAAPDAEDPIAESITFEPSSLLELTPSERRELEVSVSPPGEYRVRFALIGESFDASLDRSETDTAEDGSATVRLTAPSNALSAAFRVRASVEPSLAAELQVAVSSSGFASLEVRPEYTGTRQIAWWLASVHVGWRCQEFTSNPPPDSSEYQSDAVFRSFPKLASVPAGQPMAVTVRGENKAGGCTDVTALVVQELNAVDVSVSDVPLKLDETDLKLSFGFDSISPAAEALVTPAVDAAVVSVLGGAEHDAVALLDAMEESVADDDPETGFARRREYGSWDVSLWQGSPRPTPIRDALAPLLAGGGQVFESGMLLEATLKASETPETARLLPTALAGIGALDAGLPAEEQEVSWKAAPSDVVLLGALLPWSPSLLVASAAEAAALDAEAAPETMGALLATEIDCAFVAEELVARGYPELGESYLGCDSACTEALCETALEKLWERARTTGDRAEINVSATGNAKVDGDARVVDFDGQWLGGITMAETQLATVQGVASGRPPFENPPTR